jgi:hypothetical protein
MIPVGWKLMIVFSLASAVALTAPSAAAQSKRKVSRKPASASVCDRPPCVYMPSFGESYNRHNLPPGGYINFNDGRSGANYSPNGG